MKLFLPSDTPRTVVNFQSLREQVYDFLRTELHAGRLAPGSAVNIAELSHRLGISKTPLRDALIQLEGEGFVTISPGEASSSRS